MSKANKRKRLWNQIKRQSVTDSAGHEGTIFTPPEEWLEMDPNLSDAQADRLLAMLREAGVQLWLHPDRERGIVRTRMLFPPGSLDPTPDVIETFQHYARALGKAIARSGDWDAPEGNPFGDQPLPPGGHWEWGDE